MKVLILAIALDTVAALAVWLVWARCLRKAPGQPGQLTEFFMRSGYNPPVRFSSARVSDCYHRPMTKETAEALNQFSLAVINLFQSLELTGVHDPNFDRLIRTKAQLDQALYDEANRPTLS